MNPYRVISDDYQEGFEDKINAAAAEGYMVTHVFMRDDVLVAVLVNQSRLIELGFAMGVRVVEGVDSKAQELDR